MKDKCKLIAHFCVAVVGHRQLFEGYGKGVAAALGIELSEVIKEG